MWICPHLISVHMHFKRGKDYVVLFSFIRLSSAIFFFANKSRVSSTEYRVQSSTYHVICDNVYSTIRNFVTKHTHTIDSKGETRIH